MCSLFLNSRVACSVGIFSHNFVFARRWRIVVDHFVWALCFVPGFFGILLSINSCRKSHHNCKPAVEEDEERPRRSAPHPCALPAYMLLLLSVVVALGMHASAMLFCQVRYIYIFACLAFIVVYDTWQFNSACQSQFRIFPEHPTRVCNPKQLSERVLSVQISVVCPNMLKLYWYRFIPLQRKGSTVS